MGAIKTVLGPKTSRFFYGWWIAVAAGINLGYFAGVMVWSRSAFFRPIAEEFRWDATTTSLALALPGMWGFFLPVITGYFIDRYGARRIMVVGVLLFGSGLILTSFAFSFWSFVIFMALATAGMSMGMVAPATAAIIHWFNKKRGRALSVMWTGSSLGGWALPPFFVWLIARTDWREAMLMAGVIALAIGLPLAMLMRSKPEPYGYLPDGATAAESSNPSGGRISPGINMTPKEALRTRTFWLITLTFALLMLSFGSLGFHQIPYFKEELGISPQTTAFVISVTSLLALIGRWLFGYMADIYDQRVSIAIIGVFQAASMFLIAGLGVMGNPSWHIWVFAALYGPSYGGMIPVITTFMGERFGRKHFAAIQGFQHIGSTSVTFFGPVAVGLVLDATGSRVPAFLGIACAMAFVPILAMAIPKAPVKKPPVESRKSAVATA